jgi:hypothetical protein
MSEPAAQRGASVLYNTPAMQSLVTLSLGEFQLIALTRALRSLRAIGRQAEIIGNEMKFEKREPSPLLTGLTARDLADEIGTAGESAQASHPSRAHDIERIAKLGRELAHARTSLDALRIYHELIDLPDTGASLENVHFSADRLRVYVTVKGSDDYLGAISELFSTARAAKRAMPASEQAALDVADWRLRAGAPLKTPFACLGTSGFRAIQTWLALADPGPDHVRITAWDAELLRGLVVHVEHIDRDMIADKEKIEPYRLPAAWHAARVRLRVGTSAPCTAFIGRPIFENHGGPRAISDEAFEMDLLKTVHLHASACTAMFVNGICDCKIAIERMNAAQAVRFMRAVSGNVLRDRDRQTLSAAFNLNTPLVLSDGAMLTGRFEIGMKGIELARAGGFEKVTWDGASNEVPSRPIVEQLTHAELVDLVHCAHENGLETYISAGMVAKHMENAVYSGVDGVGIGTSMHYVDGSTKLMGALKPDAIRAALAVRDAAAARPLGSAAVLLARLDQMHFEGSLLESEEATRQELYHAVREKRETEAAACAAKLGRVLELEPFDLLDNPTLARGRRRLALLRLERGTRDQRASILGEAIERSDAVTVRELLTGDATNQRSTARDISRG